MSRSISVQALKKLLNQKQSVSLLDVRRKSDYETSPQMIEAASWCDPEKVEEWIEGVPKDREVVVYCVKGGSVSQGVADRLQKAQCRVKYLEGGIKAWTEAGVLG